MASEDQTQGWAPRFHPARIRGCQSKTTTEPLPPPRVGRLSGTSTPLQREPDQALLRVIVRVAFEAATLPLAGFQHPDPGAADLGRVLTPTLRNGYSYS